MTNPSLPAHPTINPGARGIDAYALVPVSTLAALGWCEFVGMYLKNMSEPYWRALIAAGIAPLFTSEHSETSAEGGAALGAQHANQALLDAAKYHIPAGSIIIFTNDTALTADGPYMAAASPIIRGAGFQFGIYAGTAAVNDALAHGAVIDFVHAPGARSWGTHPSSNVQQHAQDTVTIPGYTVDRNDCLRAFYPFGQPAAPPIIQFPPNLPPTPPIAKGQLMFTFLQVLASSDPNGPVHDALFGGLMDSAGLIPSVQWFGPGDGSAKGLKVQARVAALAARGAGTVKVGWDGVANVTLCGPVPTGADYAWTGAEFGDWFP